MNASLFQFFGKSVESRGYVGRYRLGDWWEKSFTETEREYVTGVFPSLLEGGIQEPTGESPTFFLLNLSGWFRSKDDRHIAHKIIAKAEEFVGDDPDVINRHFFHMEKMRLFYKGRDTDPSALGIAIQSALNQIDLSRDAAAAFRKEYSESPLPAHEGYSQLCVIYEKQGKYEDSIALAERAKSQGWNGEWDSRIEKCRKKLERV